MRAHRIVLASVVAALLVASKLSDHAHPRTETAPSAPAGGEVLP